MASVRKRRALLAEPMLHFVLLGAGLFALHGWLNGSGAFAADTIVVDQGRIDHLAAGFARLHQRAPQAHELQGLIEESVKEEIFYREALAQGLDRDDVIVRRRMMQKLEFAADDFDPLPEPNDAQLQAWLDAHPSRFAASSRSTFKQVYLDPSLHGDALQADAQRLLATLRMQGASPEAAALGDPSLLEHAIADAPHDAIRARFGAEFAQALQSTPTGGWQGPLASGYGLHVVWIDARNAARMPALSEVRADVRREWLHAQRQARDARFYADLRKRYDVRIETAAPASHDGQASASVAELAQ
jgi:hypothetical protein